MYELDTEATTEASDERLEALLQRKAWADAEQLIYERIEADRHNAENYVLLSRVLLSQGNPTLASVYLANARDLIHRGQGAPNLQQEIEAQTAVIELERIVRESQFEDTEPDPYPTMPDYTQWQTAVAGKRPTSIPIQQSPKIKFNKSTSIACIGDQLAQELGQWLILEGRNCFAPDATVTGLLPREPAARRDERRREIASGSRCFELIHTPLQFVQLLDWAYGESNPEELVWLHDDGFIDPYRPSGHSLPFPSIADLLDDRDAYFADVRDAVETHDVFVFCFASTEAWRSKLDGAVFPLRPGSRFGSYSPQRHEFINFNAEEIGLHLESLIARMSRINPGAHLILAVSPNSPEQTFEDRPVLQSWMYSKSALRVAVDQVCQLHHHVDYFAAYEMTLNPIQRQWMGSASITDKASTETETRQLLQTFMENFYAPESTILEVQRSEEKKELLFVGNCITNGIFYFLKLHSTFSKLYNINVFYTEEEFDIPDELMSSASVMLYSAPGWHDEMIPGILSKLNPNCHTIEYPHPRSTALWPFSCRDERCQNEGLIGDSYLLKLMSDGRNPSKVAEEYLRLNILDHVDVRALHQKEMEAAAYREENLPIKISSFIEKNFATMKLFDIFHHPSNVLLLEIANQILRLLGFQQINLSFAAWSGPLLGQSIPIHPSVADALSLEFYDPDEKYFVKNNLFLTFKEYVNYYQNIN